MKKARKIKVNGVEYKWFLDTGRGYRVILYTSQGERYWNISSDTKVDTAMVKQAILNDKFGGVCH